MESLELKNTINKMEKKITSWSQSRFQAAETQSKEMIQPIPGMVEHM
jgi:hypothetical protein